ncbi:hypothetical protein HT031_006095 [Scenedesmus sp. PABB004]|nr:hypothetical protein HT031_006095 [Scenedesmus sp. PABB004]
MPPLPAAAASAAQRAPPAAPAQHQQHQQRRRRRPPAAAPAPQHQLPNQQLLRWERDGFTVSRGLLPREALEPVRDAVQRVVAARRLEALRHRVRVLCPEHPAPGAIATEAEAERLIDASAHELGFLQFFNLHRTEPAVDALARSAALAGAAAQLLGTKRVRLYQDAVFLKQPGYSETNWHSDLRMAPLDANAFVTAWLPLRAIGASEGLVFAAGSHRDMALTFWHDLRGRDLSDRGYRLRSTGAMDVGDVSWHHGWALHGAPPQPPGTAPRLALALSFFADGARLLARTRDPSVHQHMLHDEDAESYAPWLHDLRDGAPARHALLPLVWPPGGERSGDAGGAAASEQRS